MKVKFHYFKNDGSEGSDFGCQVAKGDMQNPHVLPKDNTRKNEKIVACRNFFVYRALVAMNLIIKPDIVASICPGKTAKTRQHTALGSSKLLLTELRY